MIFKQHRCKHELQFVNNPNAGDLVGIFGNLRDCSFYNKVYCIKCGFNFKIKDGADIKFVEQKDGE